MVSSIRGNPVSVVILQPRGGLKAMVVTFFCGMHTGAHRDERRWIVDVEVPRIDGEAMMDILNAKTVFIPKAGVVVGNHFHTNRREETFVAVGEGDGVLFTLRYRLRTGEDVRECQLRRGEGVFLPAGVSHSFRSEQAGVCLFGFSNKPVYNPDDDVEDKLF